MATWTVKDKNGNIRCSVKKLEYNGEWMGERTLTLTVESPTPVSFAIGDYIGYRGEKFVLTYDPTVTKKAQQNKVRDGFVYDNITFQSQMNELVTCDFLDVVKSDNKLHYTSLPEFSFYAATVQDLADRLQANLDRLYTEEEGWGVVVGTISDGVVNQNVSISNNNCWEALGLVQSQFELDFACDTVTEFTKTVEEDDETKEYTCHKRVLIGYINGEMGSRNLGNFHFGKDERNYSKSNNGICELTANVDESEAVITRLRAYGNTTNMPNHYYIRILKDAMISARVDSGVWFNISITPPSETTDFPTWLTESTTAGVSKEVSFRINNILYKAKYHLTPTYSCHWEATGAAIPKALLYSKIRYFESGVNYYNLPDTFRALPNNMAVQRLMLPDFPDIKTDPYIDSDGNHGDHNTSSVYGIKEATVFFDGSDDRDDIYPSIEGATAKDLVDVGYFDTLPKDWKDTDPLDALCGADAISDSGIFEDNETITPSTFTVYIRDVGFDINDYAVDTSNYGTISFRDGMLGGREFTIKERSYNSSTFKYSLVCERVKDDSTGYWYPNKDYNAKYGDKFAFLNIYMPDLYVQMASNRLLTAAEAYLADNDVSRYKYEPKIDNVFMARQNDWAHQNEVDSYHDIIREGDKFGVEDTDLGVNNYIAIEKLTIKEQEERIPQYTITLSEDKTVGTIQQIQDSITKIKNGGVSGSINSSQVMAIGDSRYLRKDTADTANGKITFAEGVDVKGTSSLETLNVSKNATVEGNVFAKGNVTVSGSTTAKAVSATSLKVSGESALHQTQFGDIDFEYGTRGTGYDEESGVFQVEQLSVLKKMSAAEVEIQKVSHIGGKLLSTCASMTISHAYQNGNQDFVCFFEETDSDGRTVYNQFKVGDQAYCETFNIKNSGGFKNQYYWRLVETVGDSSVASTGLTYNNQTFDETNGTETFTLDGTYYNYVILSYESCEAGSTHPKKGDDIVCLGHIKQTGESTNDSTLRQGAIILAAADSQATTYVPYLSFYKEIGAKEAFKLPDPFIKFSPKENWIRGAEISLESNGTKKITDVIDGLQDDIDTVSSQIDESFKIYQADTTTTPIPNVDVTSPANKPASEWDESEYSEHVGDFYLTSDGMCYMWRHADDESYRWEQVNDAYLTAYVKQIGEKARVYVSADEPTGAKEGDLWINDGMLKTFINGEWTEDSSSFVSSSQIATTIDSALMSTELKWKDADGTEHIVSKASVMTTANYVQIIAQDANAKTAIVAAVNEGKSSLDLNADDIKISANESGSIKFGDVFKIENGDVFAQNINVKGALNNYVTELDKTDTAANGLLIDFPDSDTYITSACDPKPSGNGYKRYSIDFQRCGGLIELVNNDEDSEEWYIYLPIKVRTGSNTYFIRPDTLYGKTALTQMTAEEMRQLNGRSFHFENKSENGAPKIYLVYGCLMSETADDNIVTCDTTKYKWANELPVGYASTFTCHTGLVDVLGDDDVHHYYESVYWTWSNHCGEVMTEFE